MEQADAIVVDRARAGDHQAFATLYDRRARLIRVVCLDHTRNRDAALDLTQEVFLRAYQKLSTLRHSERFVSWLLGIARQVCREWTRAQIRQRTAAARLAAAAPCPAESGDRPVDLDTALAQLSPRERYALHAFHAQGRRIDEVCTTLRVSRSGAYHLLLTARSKLQRIMQREDRP